MKNIIKLIILLVGNVVFAQYPVLSTTSLANEDDRFDHATHGNYAMDTANERAQYLGLWRYQSDGILFELKIELEDQETNIIESDVGVFYYYMDRVTLRYKLVKNGVTLHDNLNSVNIEGYIVSYGSKYVNYNLDGKILDYTRNVAGQYKITRLNTTPPKIIFKLNEFNYTLINPDSFYQEDQPLFSLPLGNIEMEKVD